MVSLEQSKWSISSITWWTISSTQKWSISSITWWKISRIQKNGQSRAFGALDNLEITIRMDNLEKVGLANLENTVIHMMNIFQALRNKQKKLTPKFYNHPTETITNII